MRDVRVLLLYPPNQSLPGTMCKPNGSLAYPSLAGALRRHGTEVAIYDACVGNGTDSLDEVFYGSATELPSGLLRTGVPDERILTDAAGYDVVGLTSIFTEQETMVLRTARLIRAHFPDKVLVAGGVNARSRLPQFFDAGFDVVCLSESEETIIHIVEALRASRHTDFTHINGIAVRVDGAIRINPVRPGEVRMDLDTLPIPEWRLLPNERYWTIGRPHGGAFAPGDDLRYASLMTSLGCPFHCSYCHIAGEQEDSDSGFLGRYRIKSDDRVLEELEVLKSLGVKQVFIEDDSLLADRKRSLRLLTKIQDAGLDILDVNGVNVVHLMKRWKPDHEVLQALVNAGFTELVLPFESGNPRILKKYASNKLNIVKNDIEALIGACKDYGLRVAGNYMLGYPDETLDEIQTTIDLARRHISYGLDAANFFLVMPLPGTPLYDMACRDGHLSGDFNPDTMNWTRANMKGTLVPAEQLEAMRDQAWDEMNSSEFKAYKKTMVAGTPKLSVVPEGAHENA
ncbi:B12-binding domain-containing radical SAM protein [Micromonospora sp. NBS 11-29]|uniref:B12-binding domain-containing radical SAM protein n=1 Tax=Micromonospora sp. NBS 11-29 TaxID=1960879 RepID=UPI0020CE0608|nr:radical SAM protein [Micromonospora sp. NBS 11-29]